MKPTLFILCGLPFSGKTTLGARLASETGAVLVSYDALWREVFGATGQSCGYEELSAMAEARLRDALESGRDAIYDTLNDTRAGRDRLRGLAAEAGAETTVLYLDTPADIRAARRERCRITGERHPVASKILAEAIARFEAPAPEEYAVVVSPDPSSQASTSVKG